MISLGFSGVECADPYSVAINDLVAAKNDANVEQVLINSFKGTFSLHFFSFFYLPLWFFVKNILLNCLNNQYDHVGNIVQLLLVSENEEILLTNY